MYYEQDHSYIGEQQTLLLPRWIHQQRQIMQQTQETEAKMMWMRQQQQLSMYQSFHQQLLFPFQSMDSQSMATDAHNSYHRYSPSFSSTASNASSTLSPSMSPMSPVPPLTPQSPVMNPFSLGFGAGVVTGLNDPFMSAKTDSAFSSTLTGLEQQMLSDTSLLYSSTLSR
ncbi:hypothetical protein BC939DRAFT_467739 [Gamsiella multidivaricata]|uniref:uncharacterized protein n=1 Tax=Gamsiella multidivaricata TaxID=101098 RepID=UPI00221EE081|nr:uncharacterized protein BC939DRAFT_467739 [Gamsiella multidivaricata]KAI7816791.1 hypothetical protein BC939DRAFT_467739 [Gamsiella multidivaricata]